MQFREERQGRVAVITPHGEMDVTTLPAFEARISRLIDEGVRGVLFDLGAVTLVPSTALGFLLATQKRLAAVGGCVALACAKSLVARTLRLLGALDAFPLYATREEGESGLRARLT